MTTNVPGCRDSIIPNITGILVPPRDSKTLADAIQTLIENPNIRISMGKAGRRLAEKEYKIEIITSAHLEMYKTLIKNFYS